MAGLAAAAGSLTPRGAELARIMGPTIAATRARDRPRPPGMPAGVRVRRPDGAHAGHGEGAHRGIRADCGYTYRTRADAEMTRCSIRSRPACAARSDDRADAPPRARGGDLNRIDARPEGAVRRAAIDPAVLLAVALHGAGRGEKCTLADLPTVMSPLPDGGGLAVIGALPIASTTAESCFSSTPTAIPVADVAWGRATPPQMLQRGACTRSISTSRSARRTSRARWARR